MRHWKFYAAIVFALFGCVALLFNLLLTPIFTTNFDSDYSLGYLLGLALPFMLSVACWFDYRELHRKQRKEQETIVLPDESEQVKISA
jgi:hypothetical protein